jgi:hypothetical protein
MERPSCVGCFFTSSVLLVFFTTLICFVLSLIFRNGENSGFGVMSIRGSFNFFMEHKTLTTLSFLIALLPTFYFAATINDIYVNYVRKKEKETEAAVQAYHESKNQKLYDKTLPKADTDLIDPSVFKAPSKSLPKNMKKKEQDDKDKDEL